MPVRRRAAARASRRRSPPGVTRPLAPTRPGAGAGRDPRDLRGDRPLLGTPASTGRRDRARGRLGGFFENAASCPTSNAVQFVGRAITPPRRPRRFDTRFFAVDRTAIAGRGRRASSGPDKELVELVWVDLEAAQRARHLPPITVVMLEELEDAIDAGFGTDLPVPFYRELRGRFVREEL